MKVWEQMNQIVAELKADIANAKTHKEKLEALEALADFVDEATAQTKD